ncbi:helix-turn-helix domain-containing protein [Profundibacter sp.]|uniref:helix-turn-helix domain-containing protein n=1 Tax=Profundibacter sp. TaxID=3101071 RepID=UPI003D0C45CB
MAGAVRTEAYQNFLAALVDLRKAKGLSQADLANLLGKPASFVGKCELGERRLDVVETFVILNALGEEPAGFLEGCLGKAARTL